MFFYWFNRAEWPENLYRELFWRDTGEGTQMPRDFRASLEYVLMTGMTEREALAIKCRYQYKETYVQIGQRLGVQQERIRQILIKCIHKLRHPSRARLLRQGIVEYICQYGDKCKEAAYEEGYQKGFKNAGPDGRERAPVCNPYGACQRVPVSSVERINIEELDLSVRTYNGLKRANLNTVGDVMTKSKQEIFHIQNLGKGSLRELEEKLASLDVQLREE